MAQTFDDVRRHINQCGYEFTQDDYNSGERLTIH